MMWNGAKIAPSGVRPDGFSEANLDALACLQVPLTIDQLVLAALHLQGEVQFDALVAPAPLVIGEAWRSLPAVAS